MSIDVDTAAKTATFIDKLTTFEGNHRSFINLILRPMLMLIIFLAVGYYTMWLSTNYVKADKFAAYIEKQIQADKQQDEVAKSRFEITQTKLETIINQQVAYTEQLKAYNQLMANYQKQMDSMNDRVMYLERWHRDNSNK
ncbi:MAG: hypothetical protein EBU90_01115 [Proteobacteria bacterium]|nr:hypothetical protein [Pseudomonadota bacterium]NBP13019.1 hypothetical protein [bacterium]